MREDVREAIESACSTGAGMRLFKTNRVALATMKLRLLQILAGLPEDMTVRELREEIEE